MKDEIEKILSAYGFDKFIPAYREMCRDKILQLFNDKIDSAEDEITENLQVQEQRSPTAARSRAKYYINIIKERCK